jgi:endonuclease/exonuclease/phosphatase family metal-dependent hydrolase
MNPLLSIWFTVSLVVPISIASLASNVWADTHQNINVMTQNVYFGADLSPIFGALDPIAAAAFVWTEVQASDIPGRAAEIGDQIAQAEPALVALQEAAQWTGPDSTGATVQYDFLQSILQEVTAKGAHYAAIKVVDDLNITVPIGYAMTGPFVHFTDRDILLARTDLPPGKLGFTNIQGGPFSTLLIVPTGFGPITVPRSWISADVRFGGRNFRFITTHLESFSSVIQVAQAAELLSGPADTSLPVVMAGDFNSNANGQPNLPDNTPTYGDLLAGGFSDIWTAVGHKVGNTCCQEGDLLNFPSQLTERIDLVMAKSGVTAASERIIDDHNEDRVTSSAGLLWPSDHGGLVSVLKIP